MKSIIAIASVFALSQAAIRSANDESSNTDSSSLQDLVNDAAANGDLRRLEISSLEDRFKDDAANGDDTGK